MVLGWFCTELSPISKEFDSFSALFGQVLPESFFIPEGEPWEMATSTTGDW